MNAIAFSLFCIIFGCAFLPAVSRRQTPSGRVVVGFVGLVVVTLVAAAFTEIAAAQVAIGLIAYVAMVVGLLTVTDRRNIDG